MHEHLTPHILGIVYANEDEARLALIESCPRCREADETFEDWALIANHPNPLVVGEVDTSRALLAHLRQLPLKEALHRISIDGDFHRWGLARRALLAAQRLLAAFPEGEQARPAFAHALIAVAVAYQLDWDFYGTAPWANLLEEVLKTLRTARKALGRAVKLEGLLDSLFDLLLELSAESLDLEQDDHSDPHPHRGLESLIQMVEQTLEVAVESAPEAPPPETTPPL